MQHTKKMSWEDPEFLEQFRAEEARKAARKNEPTEVKAKREYFCTKQKEHRARQTPDKKEKIKKQQARRHIENKAKIEENRRP